MSLEIKKSLFIILSLIFIDLIFAQDSVKISVSPGYPRWLKTVNSVTDQTSGISFFSGDEKGKHFLLADDTGFLHHLIINSDSILNIKKIHLSGNVAAYLSGFPKKDFEEIMYDRFTGKVYLSIEGNNPSVKSVAGIYEIGFKNNNIMSDTVISIEKYNVRPGEIFYKYVENNIGFEGLAADENYFYAALEGFQSGLLFADSTLIYVIDRKYHSVEKVISTKNTGIHTICGLYSDENFSLYGVDRNNRNFFHIKLNESLGIESVDITKIPASVPKYGSLSYVVSLESITRDDENNLYFIDDPWRTFYVPGEKILKQLDDETVRNFKNFVPVIYKFKFNN